MTVMDQTNLEVQPDDVRTTDVQGSDDQRQSENHKAAVIADLREWQVQREAAVRSMNRLTNQGRALLRRRLGWQFDMPDAERNKINAKAAKLFNAVTRDGDMDKFTDHEVAIANALLPFLLAVTQQTAAPIETYRKELERLMEKAAKSLLVWPWVKEQKGIGPLALAQIIGEAGDLSNYANPAKLWKRMGVGIVGDEAQRKHTDKVLAAAHGYSPRRRSVMWRIGDAIIKSGGGGPWRALYDERKAYEYTQHPEPVPRPKGKGKQFTPMHLHRRAQRYMEKRLLKKLWAAWRASG